MSLELAKAFLSREITSCRWVGFGSYQRGGVISWEPLPSLIGQRQSCVCVCPGGGVRFLAQSRLSWAKIGRGGQLYGPAQGKASPGWTFQSEEPPTKSGGCQEVLQTFRSNLALRDLGGVGCSWDRLVFFTECARSHIATTSHYLCTRCP